MTIAQSEVSSAAAPSAQNATRVPFLDAKIHALGLVVMKLVVGRVQLLARQCQAIRGRRVGFVRHVSHLKRQEERQSEDRRRHRRIGVISRRSCECLSSLIFIMISSSNGDGLDARRLKIPKLIILLPPHRRHHLRQYHHHRHPLLQHTHGRMPPRSRRSKGSRTLRPVRQGC